MTKSFGRFKGCFFVFTPTELLLNLSFLECMLWHFGGLHRLSSKFLSLGNFIDCLRVHDAEDPDRWEEACGNLALRVSDTVM